MPLITSPGTTSSNDNRMTLRSNGARLVLRKLRFGEWVETGLEPIFFHPPVQGATAQAQRFRRLTHVALKALQRFANKDTFNGLQTQFLKVQCLRTLNSQSKVGWLNLIGAAHQDSPFQRVFWFT